MGQIQCVKIYQNTSGNIHNTDIVVKVGGDLFEQIRGRLREHFNNLDNYMSPGIQR